MTNRLPTKMVMCVTVALAFLQGRPAAAEAPPGAQSERSSPAYPDVIRLKNGGLVRGTIAELVPNESVTIVSITSETKRFAMAEVEYAGPDSKPSQPGAPVGSPQSPPDHQAMHFNSSAAGTKAGEEMVEVQFESAPAGAIFYQHSDITTTVETPRGGILTGIGYKTICTAPCKAELPVGTYALAMSYAGSPPREGAPVRVQKQTTHLHGNYVSRSSERKAGIGVALGGLVAGMAVTGIGFAQTKTECVPSFPCRDVPDPDAGLIVAGIGITIVGMAVAAYLLTRYDEVALSVTPQDATRTDSTPRPPAPAQFKRNTDVWNSSLRTPQSPGANLLSYSWQF